MHPFQWYTLQPCSQAPSAPSRTVSLRERIAQLREETGTLASQLHADHGQYHVHLPVHTMSVKDKNVQNLRERQEQLSALIITYKSILARCLSLLSDSQDSGLAALQFANESVAEARSGLNQSMLSAEGCGLACGSILLRSRVWTHSLYWSRCRPWTI